MKELPRVFANKIDKKIENNENYAVSKNKEAEIKQEEYKGIPIGKNINQKINDIFSSYKYVYKADVIITTDNGEITKKIIGKNNNNLITIDNELININTIKDIRFKD